MQKLKDPRGSWKNRCKDCEMI